MPRVELKGHIVVPHADLEAVKAELPEHIRLTRAERGCLSFEVSPTEKDQVFNVHEVFADRESFEAHQQRSRNSPWGDAAANVERHYKIRELD